MLTFASIIGFALFHTTIRFFCQAPERNYSADAVSIDYLMGQGIPLGGGSQQNAYQHVRVSLPTKSIASLGVGFIWFSGPQ